MLKETILVEESYGCLLNKLHEMLLKSVFQQQNEQTLYSVHQKSEDFIGILKDEIIDYGHLTTKHMNGYTKMLCIQKIQNYIRV
jgi:hypothetical protein